MKDYQERVVKERNEVRDRLNKLMGFIRSEECKALGRAEGKRLLRQMQIMTLYMEVLDERIEYFEEIK
jgi:hypothetical protein